MSSLTLSLITDSLGLKTKKKKFLTVEVCTKESKFVFDEIPMNATGKDIFERICRALGLRETHYFGLQYVDNKNTVAWLDLKKKIIDQNVVFNRSPMMPHTMINHAGQNHQRAFWSNNCSPSSSPSALSLSTSPLTQHQIIEHQPQSPYQSLLQPNFQGNITNNNNNNLHPAINSHASIASNISTSDYALPLTNNHHLPSHQYQHQLSLMTSSSSHLCNGNQGSIFSTNDVAAPRSLTNLGPSVSYNSDIHHQHVPQQYSSPIILQQTLNAQQLHPLKRVQHLQASPPISHQGENTLKGNFHYGNSHYHQFAGCSHGLYNSFRTTARVSLEFLVKFYPVSIDELIDDVTQHLFFLQLKENIIEGRIDCPLDVCMRLAALAAQAKFGEFNEKTYQLGMLTARNLLPKRLMINDPQQAEAEIKSFHNQYKDLTQGEAELEYLVLVRSLPKCGVSYFPVKDKNGSNLWLGVTPLGLNIYEYSNQNEPKIQLLFREIRNLEYNKKKFTIERWSSPEDIVLVSARTFNNEQAYCLCIGYYELLKKREGPETMEIKQMKAQVMEEKQRRLRERVKLVQEKERLEKMERDYHELEHRLRQYQAEAQSAHESLCKKESEALYQAEEARKARERAAEIEREMQRIKIGGLKTEQGKSQNEVHEAVYNALGAIHDVKDIYSRTMSANNNNYGNNSISNNNNNGNSDPSNSSAKISDVVSNYHNNVVMQSTNTVNDKNNNPSYASITKVTNQISAYLGEDLNQLISEHERERRDYEKKTQDLQNHLHNIASEVETIKRNQRDRIVSRVYETNI